VQTDTEFLEALVAEIRSLETPGQSDSDVRLDDLLRPQTLAARYPDLGSLSQIRWWLHHRANNGLDEHKAVIKQGKAVWIVLPRFRDWLLGLRPSAADSISAAETANTAPSEPLSNDFSHNFRNGIAE